MKKLGGISMRIPDVPIVPMDLDERTREFLGSLDDRLERIDAVRVEGDKVHVLGNTSPANLFPRYYEIVHDMKSGQESVTKFITSSSADSIMCSIFTLGIYYAAIVISREELERKHDQKASEYRQANLREAEAKVKDIRVYQGSVDEVSGELGKPLERVDTDKPETYLHMADILNLRVQAYHLGANLVVHCQPGSSIGTPVRYTDKTTKLKAA